MILESPLSVIVQDHIQAILLYGGVLIVFHLNRAVGGVLSILGQLVPDFQRSDVRVNGLALVSLIDFRVDPVDAPLGDCLLDVFFLRRFAAAACQQA
ncbi:MAG: hypothetical protein MR579_03850 [Bacteroidales bacterium]|nr:hypothetical protein [Bacteroidales bacterium]